jgi:hypothetical protein
MAQQTAVEKLESTIQSMIEHGADLGEDYPALMVHIQQAKEMEKQQIEDAQMDMFNHINDRKFGMDYFHKRDEAETYVKHYYTETYKSE